MLSKVLTCQKGEISALEISENLNIFIACSKDGNCMTYSLPRIKLINSFNIESRKDKVYFSEKVYCDIILIYHAPLP